MSQNTRYEPRIVVNSTCPDVKTPIFGEQGGLEWCSDPLEFVIRVIFLIKKKASTAPDSYGKRTPPLPEYNRRAETKYMDRTG